MNIYFIAALALLLGIVVFHFKANVKEWLLWAVTDAENFLGSGTGKLKLRYVYDKFCEKFPAVKYLLPFSVFSAWVDEALVLMRKEIEQNPNIAAFAQKSE